MFALTLSSCGGLSNHTYKVNYYTVTFDKNGYDNATNWPENQTVKGGGFVTKPEDPILENYVFDGWSESYNSSYFWDFDNDRIFNMDMTLYARWHKYRADPNQLDTPDFEIDGDYIRWNKVDYATKLQLVISRNNAEYYNEFKDNYRGSMLIPTDLDAGVYTVKMRAIGDGINYYNSSYGQVSLSIRIIPAVKNISFDKDTGIITWDKIDQALNYELLVDNLTSYKTARNWYDLSYLSGGDHTVSITATRDNWISSTGSISFTIHKLAKPLNLVASFNETTLECEVTWDEVKAGSGYAGGYRIYLNDNYVETVNTNKYTIEYLSSYYKQGFVSIQVASFDPNTDYLMSDKTEAITIEQRFLIEYELNGGTNDPTNPTWYTTRQAITFAEPTKTGYSFAGWFSKGYQVRGIRQGSVGTFSVEARWNPLQNNLSVSSEDTSKGTVRIKAGSGYSGEEITVQATPKGSWVFDGWYSNNVLVGVNENFTFNMPASDYSLIAKCFTQSEDDERNEKYALKPVVSNDGKTMTYGLYPQKNVNTSSLISALNTLTTPEANGWYLYNGNYYAKLSAKPWTSGYKFDNGQRIYENTTYWFKCEPIVWNILSANNGEYFVVSSVLLDAHRFSPLESEKVIDGKTIYSNNYKYSEIREWLNGYFYAQAFLFGDFIQTTNVDNSVNTLSGSYTQVACENTNDKVFLPSYKDYVNQNYSIFISSTTRCCKTTDWARAIGSETSTSNDYLNNGYFWTRSPGDSYGWRVTSVSTNGNVSGYSASDSGVSVRPAITISLS